MIQQVAEILKVDPLMLLSIFPNNIIENGNNSPNTCNANNEYYNYQTTNEQQVQLLINIMENVTLMTDKLLALLSKPDQK